MTVGAGQKWVTDEAELLAEAVELLGKILERIDATTSQLEEFLPAIRALYDPNQGGVRGAAIRRAMTKGARGG